MKFEQNKKKGKKRTVTQNRALHKSFDLIAEELNSKGKDIRTVLKEGVDVWWTGYMVKEYLWKPFQKLKLGKKSTTELDKLGEIEEVYDDLMRNLGEKHGIDYIDFPNIPDGEKDKDGRIQINDY